MKYIIKESSFLNLVVTMVESMERPEEVCYVETNVNRAGDINLTVFLDAKKGYSYDDISVVRLRRIRDMYQNTLESYFGTKVNILFDNSYDCEVE
jgi:hypothetical protein